MRPSPLGESEPLLSTASVDVERSSHLFGNPEFLSGSTPTNDDFGSEDSSIDEEDDDDAELKRKRDTRLKDTGGWLGYIRDFNIFLPYLIPRKDVKVQACLIVCLLCLTGRRILNIMVPQQLGLIADKLINHQPLHRDLLLWLGLSILNDTSGLGMIQELALIPIRQFSAREITNASFKHVLDLSMDFHEERDSAEVMKALEQGGALTKLLETAVCQVLPTIIDLTIAFGVLYWKFGIHTSLIVVTAISLFFALEILTSRWKVEPRRRFTKAERQETRVMHQAIQGWTTASYFNMFRFERWRLEKTLDTKLAAERKWITIENLTQGGVDLLIPLTFFALTANTIHNISEGRSKPGDFVFLIQYWEYLIWPLKFLSHDYRELMSTFIDAERLLALLQVSPTIFDREEALEIGSVNGHVTFENVSFAYDGRNTMIKDVDFSVQPGQTIALAGATGAGKSTIVKLLLRFYDVTGGRITIDDYDIRDVTLDSLRNNIGIVPQNPMLFNGTILDNLRYAKPTADFPEVMSACRIAAIHDRILSFPDGYKTRVGDQGVKLSGGEAQRLAIARAVLKDPPILVLDEATSAIDTQTESNIQMALDVFKTRRKRTTFVVAHRLNTLMRADQILVFDGGSIVEKGTHEELLQENGLYKGLWSKQIGSLT